MNLKDRWDLTLQKNSLEETEESNQIYNLIHESYTQAHRFYHTLTHLSYCFNIIDSKNIEETPNIGLIEFALWFHDIVYEPKHKDNEQKSAIIAVNLLSKIGLDHNSIKTVFGLILDTNHTGIPITLESKILIDLDLSILGGTKQEFDLFEENIRKEYSWVPEKMYNHTRANVLEMFLNDEFVYNTDYFRNSPRESQAKLNLTNLIKKLKANA